MDAERYTLGAVGIGHWFERLYSGIKNSNRITVTKAAGTNPAESKLDRLKAIGLGAENYYQIRPGTPIPKEFFKDLNIVHISDPNEFHAEQTLQSLGEGKIVVTEKTWGVNKLGFYSVMDHIKENGLEKKAYLHLHYIHKTLTIQLEELLQKYTAQYGKVKAVSATFFERIRPDDARRKEWLFSTANGGLFMDWIHPFEVLYFGAKATGMRLKDIEPYVVNKDYDKLNPTGIHAEVDVFGKFFSDSATAFVRMAKGTKESKKSMRFLFESGSYLDLNYIDSEIEFESSKRGTWEFFDGGIVIEKGAPSGPTTSEMLVSDMINMCEGEQKGISLDDAAAIFEPQWKYQELIATKKLRASDKEAERFIKCGMTMATESCILI